MKRLIPLLLLMLCGTLVAQNIYKVIDEDGNVIYTDQPPSNDAVPEDLPPLGKMDAGRSRPKQANSGSDGSNEAFDYPDFAITQPDPEENLWGTGGSVEVALDPGKPLALGHKLVLMLNGNEVARGGAARIRIDEVVRGAHTLNAVIVDEGGNEVARAPSVVFHMKQASRG